MTIATAIFFHSSWMWMLLWLLLLLEYNFVMSFEQGEIFFFLSVVYYRRVFTSLDVNKKAWERKEKTIKFEKANYVYCYFVYSHSTMMECISARDSHCNIHRTQTYSIYPKMCTIVILNQKTFIRLVWLAFEVQTKPIKMEFHIYKLQHLWMRCGCGLDCRRHFFFHYSIIAVII